MYKTIRSWNRIKEINEQKGQIFIFGCGERGCRLANDLSALCVNISGFLDNSAERINSEINGIKVFAPASINGNPTPQTLFVCCAVASEDGYWDIRHQLEGYGLVEGENFGDFGQDLDSRFYIDEFDVMNFRAGEGHDLRQKLLRRGLPRFNQGYFSPEFNVSDVVFDVINLTINTGCSLHCKDCAFAIPYVKKPVSFDAEKMAEDLDKLLSVSITPLVSMVGGEVFLHPQLDKVVDNLKKMKNYGNAGRFEVITNGTILPSKELLLQLKTLTCFGIAINDYDVKNDKIPELIERCEKIGVPYRLAREIKRIWGDHGDFTAQRGRSEAEKVHLYWLCGTCCALYGGKLYTCNRAAILQENGLVNRDENDSLDIRNYSGSNLKNDVYRLIYEKPYITTCDVCDGYIASLNGTGNAAFRQIPPAVQSALHRED